MTARLSPPLILGLSLAVGFMVSTRPQLSVAAVLGVIGVAALGAPASAWLGAALVATLSFKGLGTLGLIPSVATFADMFLVWGALLSGLLRSRRIPRSAVRPLRLLGALAVCMAASGALNQTEIVRPLVYLILLGTPFAAATALLVDPPSLRARRLLTRLLLVLLVVQIPVTLWQASVLDNADLVEGTLLGAGAGAHVISAIAVVGAIWIISATPLTTRAKLATALPLLAVPFLADAKQVVFAAPAMLVAGNWRGTRDVVLRFSAVGIALFVLLTLIPAGKTATQFLENARAGRGGKEAATNVVFDALRSDPASLLLGLGPAESVSRAAFMTTPLLLDADSPLRVLGLEPAETALIVDTRARAVSGGYTSFDTGLSSALGVLGDIGVLGAAVYVALLLSFFAALRRSSSPTAVPATCGLALFSLLGLVFDWWEQPPFGILVGVLVGLALTDRGDPPGEPAGGSGRST